MVFRYLKHLLQLILSPSNGWDDMLLDERVAYRTSAGMNESMSRWLQHRASRQYNLCFLPLAAICAATAMVQYLYNPQLVSLWTAIEMVIITFVALFLGSQVGKYFFYFYLPKISKNADPDADGDDSCIGRSLNMVTMVMSYVAIIITIENCLRVTPAVIKFLPLYAIFIIWKGFRYLEIIPGRVATFVVTTSIATLGSTALLYYLLSALIY